ncbi:MAG: hypothetical protein Q8R10_18660, partial [Pseudomonas sp.]|uniref:hypothetical protein n=1 Tax=Pseudomonas sp. TaxID=306 RepID=UPI0027334C6F
MQSATNPPQNAKRPEIRVCENAFLRSKNKRPDWFGAFVFGGCKRWFFEKRIIRPSRRSFGGRP